MKNADPFAILESWPNDWPTHAAREDIAPLLQMDEEMAEAIIMHGHLQPVAEGDYRLQDFFRAGVSFSKTHKRKSGFFDVVKLLRKIGRKKAPSIS